MKISKKSLKIPLIIVAVILAVAIIAGLNILNPSGSKRFLTFNHPVCFGDNEKQNRQIVDISPKINDMYVVHYRCKGEENIPTLLIIIKNEGRSAKLLYGSSTVEPDCIPNRLDYDGYDGLTAADSLALRTKLNIPLCNQTY